MFTKESIRKEIALSRSLEARFQKELAAKPKGTLFYKMGRGTRRPYQWLNGREVYLGKKKAETLQKLADKKKLQSSLKGLEQNLQLLKLMESEYTELPILMPDDMSMYAGVKGPIQRVAPKLSKDNLREISIRWETEHNGNTDYRPEERIHRTSDGICVRSKSELAIYEYLKSHNIPFVYELPIQLGDHLRYPDFTLLRKRDVKIFLWEHLGCMNDPIYHQNNTRKIWEYMSEDYFPLRDILFSYDYEDGSIDLLEVDRLLRGMGFIS